MRKMKILFSVLVGFSLVSCGTLDPLKERRDGNVVQIHTIRHLKSGRPMISDASTVSATNAGVVTKQLGGSTGSSVAAGGAMIAVQGILNATSDNDEYGVAVTRPDDLVPNLLGPAKPRINSLGTVKLSSIEDFHVGDWVKVKKVGSDWTLIPCRLPESGCQDKLIAK